MAFTLDPPLVNIPLQGLPIATAALDSDTVIVAANREFDRLAGRAYSARLVQRLTDIVAEPDKRVLEEAISGLSDQGRHKCSIRALRCKPPALWLEIEIARLGPESAVPFVACLQAMPRRRRIDRPPDSSPRALAIKPGVQQWSPLLIALSQECRGPLMAIRGWAQMAEKGVLPADMSSRAFTVIGRNAANLSTLIDRLLDRSLSRRTGARSSRAHRPRPAWSGGQ